MDSKDTSLDAYIARMAAAYRPRSSAPPSPSESHFTEAHKLEEALLEEALIRQALIRQALGDIAGDPDRLSPSRLRNSIDRVKAEKYDHNKVPGLIADTNETASSPRSGRSTKPLGIADTSLSSARNQQREPNTRDLCAGPQEEEEDGEEEESKIISPLLYNNPRLASGPRELIYDGTPGRASPENQGCLVNERPSLAGRLRTYLWHGFDAGDFLEQLRDEFDERVAAVSSTVARYRRYGRYPRPGQAVDEEMGRGEKWTSERRGGRKGRV
ncbi:hypothetical protein MBLNU230_g3346t1 [Neophaeotheca triangularis]